MSGPSRVKMMNVYARMEWALWASPSHTTLINPGGVTLGGGLAQWWRRTNVRADALVGDDDDNND